MEALLTAYRIADVKRKQAEEQQKLIEVRMEKLEGRLKRAVLNQDDVTVVLLLFRISIYFGTSKIFQEFESQKKQYMAHLVEDMEQLNAETP